MRGIASGARGRVWCAGSRLVRGTASTINQQSIKNRSINRSMRRESDRLEKGRGTTNHKSGADDVNLELGYDIMGYFHANVVEGGSTQRAQSPPLERDPFQSVQSVSPVRQSGPALLLSSAQIWESPRRSWPAKQEQGNQI